MKSRFSELDLLRFLDGWLEAKAEMVLHHVLSTEAQVELHRFI